MWTEVQQAVKRHSQEAEFGGRLHRGACHLHCQVFGVLGHCERTMAWVFSSATTIFQQVAQAAMVPAALCALSWARAMEQPLLRVAVSSAHM